MSTWKSSHQTLPSVCFSSHLGPCLCSSLARLGTTLRPMTFSPLSHYNALVARSIDRHSLAWRHASTRPSPGLIPTESPLGLTSPGLLASPFCLLQPQGPNAAGPRIFLPRMLKVVLPLLLSLHTFPLIALTASLLGALQPCTFGLGALIVRPDGPLALASSPLTP